MNSFGNFKFLVEKNGSHSEMRILGCDNSWSHEVIDHSGKLMSHDMVAPFNIMGKKLAFMRSSPPAASMTVWYT
jgi:hypothetical protein